MGGAGSHCGGTGSARPPEPRTASGTPGAWYGKRLGQMALGKGGDVESEQAAYPTGPGSPPQGPASTRITHDPPKSGKEGRRREHACPGATHLKWSCNATLKSKASPRSPKPIPINARRPGEKHRIGPTRRRQRKPFSAGGANPRARTVSIFDADDEVPAGIRHALHGCARKLIHRGLSKEVSWKQKLG